MPPQRDLHIIFLLRFRQENIILFYPCGYEITMHIFAEGNRLDLKAKEIIT